MVQTFLSLLFPFPRAFFDQNKRMTHRNRPSKNCAASAATSNKKKMNTIKPVKLGLAWPLGGASTSWMVCFLEREVLRIRNRRRARMSKPSRSRRKVVQFIPDDYRTPGQDVKQEVWLSLKSSVSVGSASHPSLYLKELHLKPFPSPAPRLPPTACALPPGHGFRVRRALPGSRQSTFR